MKRDDNFLEWFLIAGLLILLFAPLAGKIIGWPKPLDLKENRILAPRPDFLHTAFSNLPHAIDQWWNDRFAFRTQLIPLRESIWLDLLNAPGKQYVRGKDGHLFLNLMKGELYHGAQNATVLDYLGENRLTAEQLENWKDYLDGKNTWLAAYGIQYLFVIAPNKISVEERFLPDAIRKYKGETYLDQLREKVFPFLVSGVDLLDLTPVLIDKEKETGIPTFSRTHDVAHWNGAGYYDALIAMDKRLRRHFPQMPPFPVDKFEIKPSPDDPTNFFCHWIPDPSIHPADETIIHFRSGDWTDSKCSTADGRSGDLVFFSDSSLKAFCGGLMFFHPSGHTAFPYQWGRHRHADIQHVTFEELKQIVRKEHPDVIVEAQTERALTIPPGIGVPPEFHFAAAFARGKTRFLWPVHEQHADGYKNIDQIETDGESLLINAANNDPSLIVPARIRLSGNSKCVLLADMDAPASGTFQVFWSTGTTFSENDSIKTALEKGHNIIFLQIPIPPDQDNTLRIDPGTSPGRYRIRRIEIRSADS